MPDISISDSHAAEYETERPPEPKLCLELGDASGENVHLANIS